MGLLSNMITRSHSQCLQHLVDQGAMFSATQYDDHNLIVKLEGGLKSNISPSAFSFSIFSRVLAHIGAYFN